MRQPRLASATRTSAGSIGNDEGANRTIAESVRSQVFAPGRWAWSGLLMATPSASTANRALSLVNRLLGVRTIAGAEGSMQGLHYSSSESPRATTLANRLCRGARVRRPHWVHAATKVHL